MVLVRILIEILALVVSSGRLRPVLLVLILLDKPGHGGDGLILLPGIGVTEILNGSVTGIRLPDTRAVNRTTPYCHLQLRKFLH